MGERSMYYDRDAIPIDQATFLRLHRDLAYLRIARTTVTSAADLAKTFDVSTVWLGVNHGLMLDGPPMIFETMVFGDGSQDLDIRRYATEAQARSGHVEMVTIVAATLDDAVVMDVSK